MIIEIDSDFLVKHNISAEEYFVIMMLKRQKFDALSHYKIAFPDNFGQAIFNLEKKGFIHNLNEDKKSPLMTKIIIKEKFNSLIVTEDFFDSLLANFPLKAIRKGGKVDYLRIRTEDCRKVYAKITKGNKEVHEHILKCLDLEIMETKPLFAYMRRLPNWLANRDWEIYEQKLDDYIKQREQSDGYGQEVI